LSSMERCEGELGEKTKHFQNAQKREGNRGAERVGLGIIGTEKWIKRNYSPYRSEEDLGSRRKTPKWKAPPEILIQKIGGDIGGTEGFTKTVAS